MRNVHTIRRREEVPLSLLRIRRALEFGDFPKSGYEVTISLARRTNPQNAHYWGVVVPLVADHLTEKHAFPVTSDMAHDMLKSQFLPPSFHSTCPITGRVFYGSTTKLAKSGDGEESWQTYITKIQEWGAKSGLYIPDPGEVEYNDETL